MDERVDVVIDLDRGEIVNASDGSRRRLLPSGPSHLVSEWAARVCRERGWSYRVQQRTV